MTGAQAYDLHRQAVAEARERPTPHNRKPQQTPIRALRVRRSRRFWSMILRAAARREEGALWTT